mgnify:CR=1 FL=1
MSCFWSRTSSMSEVSSQSQMSPSLIVVTVGEVLSHPASEVTAPVSEATPGSQPPESIPENSFACS